jgi:hypothetical protein
MDSSEVLAMDGRAGQSTLGCMILAENDSKTVRVGNRRDLLTEQSWRLRSLQEHGQVHGFSQQCKLRTSAGRICEPDTTVERATDPR